MVYPFLVDPCQLYTGWSLDITLPRSRVTYKYHFVLHPSFISGLREIQMTLLSSSSWDFWWSLTEYYPAWRFGHELLSLSLSPPPLHFSYIFCIHVERLLDQWWTFIYKMLIIKKSMVEKYFGKPIVLTGSNEILHYFLHQVINNTTLDLLLVIWNKHPRREIPFSLSSKF